MSNPPPKKSTIPHIQNEAMREVAITELSPNHGYTISEVAYILNLCKRTISRMIDNGTFTAKYRGVHPLITGLQIKNYYFN